MCITGGYTVQCMGGGRFGGDGLIFPTDVQYAMRNATNETCTVNDSQEAASGTNTLSK